MAEAETSKHRRRKIILVIKAAALLQIKAAEVAEQLIKAH
jgi:hypothetical protein